MEKINENIFVMIDELFYDVVVGAIALPSKLIMIDTGMNLRKIKEFKEKVEKETNKKFDSVFITHYHGDHIIGNQLFNECKIYASKWTFERLVSTKDQWTEEVIEHQKSRIDDPEALEGLVITTPNQSFKDEFVIKDGNVEVIIKTTGGHTKGSSYVYCPNYKVLFAGDNLFINSYHWGGDATCDPDAWINALKEYLSMDIDYFVPGHGPVSDKEPVEYILNYFELVKKTMFNMHKQGKSKEEILKKCYHLDFYSVDENNEEDIEMKELTLKKWYEVWIEGKK